MGIRRFKESASQGARRQQVSGGVGEVRTKGFDLVWKIKTALRHAEGSRVFSFSPGLRRLVNHIFEQDFERHGMSATVVGKEEFAITVKNAIIIGNMMIIVVAMESKVELVEVKTLSVFSVSFCLFQLAD